MIGSESTTRTFLNRAEFLEKGDYCLVQADETCIDYIVNLAKKDKFCAISKEEIEDGFLAHAYAVWLGLYKEKLVGVVMIHKVKINEYSEIFTFDAYKEPCEREVLSAEFGRLAINWADSKGIKPLWTAHHIDNRIATIACARLGFKKITEKENRIIMRRN